MAENDASAFASAGGYPRSDEESSTAQSHGLRRKKRLKVFAYIAAFFVLQAIIILVFGLTMTHVKAPEVKIRSVTVEGLETETSSSYDMTLIAEVAIKNKNFGDYKYEDFTVTTSHGGVVLGDGLIVKGNTKARKTRRVNVTMEVSSNESSDDISSGILTFNSNATLRGRVHFLKVMKKRTTAKMNCTMAFNLTTGAIQDLNCL